MERAVEAIIALLFLAATSCSSATNHERSYSGAWFTVHYPASFRVEPSLKSSTSEGYDSAFFHSPDGRVSFYVFAPQWGGNPGDIALDETAERLTATKTSKGDDAVVTWYSIAALDGSYIRSYQQTDSPDQTSRWIIGVRYATPEDFKAYQSAYDKFKQSLQRFGD